MNKRIFTLFLTIFIVGAFTGAQGMTKDGSTVSTEERKKSIGRMKGQVIEAEFIAALKQQIRSYHNMAENDPALDFDSHFKEQPYFTSYLYSLYGALEELRNVKNSIVQLKKIEELFAQIFAQKKEVVYKDRKIKTNIIPHRLELCLGAVSCLAIGCVGGWLLNSWWSSQ